MKAILDSIDHNRESIFPHEKYCFQSNQFGPEGRTVRLEIMGSVLSDPIIKWDQRNWDFDIEIKITAKPKGELIIQL